MSRLISVGNIIVDIVVRIPALPRRGGDMLGTSEGMTPGGSFNTMVAATRQGQRCAYAGGHGTGPLGDRVRVALAGEGIDVLSPANRNEDTGFDVAMIDAEGERTFVTAFGAEAHLESIDVEPRAGDLVHVSGYGLLESTNAGVVVPWLGTVGGGVTVLFDPGPLVGDIPGLALAAMRARADWLSCNLREARLLSGRTDAGEAARALAAEWRGVVIRLGADGCLLDGAPVPGFPVEVVDTSGAGDAHVGAFLAALAAGRTLAEAARRANACAALAVSRSGPSSSPTAAEVDALLLA